MRENKGEEGEWKCCWAEGRTRKWNWHIFHRVYIFFSSKGCCRSIPVPVPLLIIPIIMAHYENVINNTEDIVVAISHMVVGLCSVTILPLASTYVCQRRAAMTSSSSAHLALPTESHTLGWGELGIPPGFSPDWIFYAASGRTGDKMSTGVWDGPSNSGAPGKARGGEEGGGMRQELFVLVCYTNTNKM